MVTSTRSGQLKKDESTSTSKSGNASRKEKDIKGSSSSTRGRSAVGKGNGSKGSTPSGSSTDSSTLRKSAGKTPLNNTSPNPNKRRSKRLATCEASVSPDERDSERVEERSTQSPLRRSKRIKKHAASCSSGLIETKQNSSPLDKTSQKNSGGKSKVLDIGEEKRKMKLGVKRSKLISSKKKRLDARSYRALFKSVRSPKKSAEDIGSRENGDSLPRLGSFIPRAGDSEYAQKIEELCNEKEEMIEEHDPGEFVKVASEGSSPNSRELGNKTLEGDMEGESAYLERKQKICFDEIIQSGHAGSCSDTKHIDSSPQPSSRGARAKSIGNDTERSNCFAGGVLKITDLTESISEGKQADVASHDAIGSLQSVKINVDNHSAVSVAPVNHEVLTSGTIAADTMSCSPSGNKDQVAELCTVCCKQKRASKDVKALDFCSCGSNFISFSQGGCVPKTIPKSCKNEMMTSSGKDDSAKIFEYKRSGESTKSQRGVILTDVPVSNLLHTTLTSEEDGRLEATDSVDSIGEPNTLQKGSSWAIQPNTGDNACVICKHPGHLLCCDGKGCRRSYHLSCIEPPLKEVPPGIWHCINCIRKKIELGFHSVSEGMESVLDARLVDSTYSGGTRKEKQYLVKYKGLAHVHNRWVPEKAMLVEAPMLLGKFNRRNQREKVTLWKEEWTVPQRLLQKRLLMQPELADECISGCSSNTRVCHYEWLVKWTGLGYEHATWEFENSSFLCTPEAMAFIRDFENRHKNATSDPSKADKAKLRRKVPLSQLPMLPDCCRSGLDGDYLNSVNKLRECWHKAQSVVFLDEQERMIKVILFILSMEPDLSRPFLIISTYTSLSLWESEFRRLAPLVNAVVYSGNKDVRKMIRSLEFYEEGGCIKFHALLSLPHAIVEDYEALDCIGWEALIVDDCQHLSVSKHLEQLKKLSSAFRLILLNGPVKDSIAEYLNLLSFLDSGSSQCSVDGMNVSCNSNIAELAIVKDRLSKYIAHNRKADCSKFLEYWVPVELSTVQLEQYCARLVSHSLSLQSCSKIDHVGALRDILISQRKCCDHPYLVDEFLQGKLTKDLQAAEYLDIGVKASGKLQLLDKILQEMKDQGRRVIILFQLVGRDGKSTIGDILDDFLRQRFGVDSYERVDSGLSTSKKQSALNMFNSKENGRFVFLIENRACLPSIRLSSVDAVIIFSSDWNPASDLRALQKISVDSLSGYVKVFRLYSSFTVEEKVLLLAKQDKTLESNIPNISCSVSQSLLCWGASYLFSKLDEFHRNEIPKIDSVSFSDKSISSDVLAEFLTEFPQNAAQESKTNYSIISKAQQSGAGYSKDILLLGEKEMPFPSEEPTHIFWSSLLDGRRNPRWRFISEPSQRARRKHPYPDILVQQPEVENDDARKKRRKVVSNSSGPKIPDEQACMVKSKSFSSLKETNISPVDLAKGPGLPGDKVHMGEQFSPCSPAHENDVCHNPECTSAGIQTSTVESEEREKLHNSQRNLHLLLKPELAKLCEALELAEDVSNIAQLFLEYVMNNNRVDREPETILQAFKISLCWRAASIMKTNLDHRASLLRAKRYLNYGCTEEEAESVHSKLRMLKKKFKRFASRNIVELKSHSQGNNSSPRKEVDGELSHEKDSLLPAFVHRKLEDGEVKRSHSDPRCSEWQLLLEQDRTPDPEAPPGKHHLHIGPLNDEILSKRVSLIEKTCSKRIEKLLQKQQLEIEEFNSFRESEKAKQQKAHELELDLICTIHLSCEVSKAKLNLLKQEFSNRMEKFEEHMKGQRRKLAVMLVEARNKEQQTRDCWFAEANAGRLEESFDKIPLVDTGFIPDEFKGDEHLGTYDGLRNVLSFCEHPIEYESTCSVVNGQSNTTQQDNVPADFLPPTSRETVEDLQVPVSRHERPSLLDRFDGGQGLNCSQAVTAATSQSSDSVPVQLVASQASDSVPAQLPPSDEDLMVHDSLPLFPQVCSDLPSVQQGTSRTSGGATKCGQELSSSQAITAASTQREDEHNNDMNCSTNPVPLSEQECIETRVNLHTAILDGLENGQRLNPLQADTFASSQECCFDDMVLRTEPSEQLIAQTTVLDPLGCVMGLNSSQNSSQQIIASSHDIADLSNGQCDIAHACIPGQHRDEFISPTNQIQISAQQSFGDIASQSGQFDIARTSQSAEGGQELNSSHDTSIQIPATTDVTFSDQVRFSPDHPLGTTSSQAGQTVTGTQQCYASIPHGSTEYPTSTTLESNGHLLQPFSVVPQASLPDPLQNELNKIRKEEDRDAEMCEKEKQRLKSELEKELEQVRKKYDSLLNDVETKFVERKKVFGTLYNKVYLNRVLAEEFRLKFAESKAQATGTSSQGTQLSFLQQLAHASQPQVSHREALASASSVTSLVSPGFVRAPGAVPHFDLALSSARTRVPGPLISSAPSSSSGPPVQVVHHSSALFSSNPLVRHPSPVLTPRGGFQVRSERAPAPHLHSFRANASMYASNFPLRPSGSVNQQQLPSHSASSMRVVNTPLAFQSMDEVGRSQGQENLSTRPILGTLESTPSLAADVREECSGVSVPNLPRSLELGQRRSFDHAPMGTGQPSSSSETAVAPPAEVICLLDD